MNKGVAFNYKIDNCSNCFCNFAKKIPAFAIKYIVLMQYFLNVDVLIIFYFIEGVLK
jgi:hypothetical protein